MKKTIATGMALALGCMACAGPKVTELDAQIMQAQAATVAACYQAEASRRQMTGYADPRDQALVIMAEAQNRAAEGVTRSVVSGAVIGTGIVAGADVLKTALTNTGARTTTTIQGDGNTASHTNYDTRANTTNNMSTRGESSPVAASNPPVSGPDQSVTEIHEAAPEALVEAAP